MDRFPSPSYYLHMQINFSEQWRARSCGDSGRDPNTRVPCRIVCVGGDGMFSEVLHGLIGRTQRNAGVDQNQPRAALVPSPLRIGIIPAGRASRPHPVHVPVPGFILLPSWGFYQHMGEGFVDS